MRHPGLSLRYSAKGLIQGKGCLRAAYAIRSSVSAINSGHGIQGARVERRKWGLIPMLAVRPAGRRTGQICHRAYRNRLPATSLPIARYDWTWRHTGDSSGSGERRFARRSMLQPLSCVASYRRLLAGAIQPRTEC